MPQVSRHNPKPSVVGSMLRFIISFIGWLLVTWVATQLILIITIAWHGHQVEFLTSTKLLTNEISCFSQQALYSPALKCLLIKNSVNWLQKISGSIPYLNVFNLETKSHVVQILFRAVYPPLTDYAHAAIAITQIVLLRIANVLLFIPLIILFGLVGLSNGLVARYLRRINGGRESSLIYHYAKLSIKPFLFWGSLLYVVLPLPLTPAYFLLPCAIGTSCAVYLTVKTFKKYS